MQSVQGCPSFPVFGLLVTHTVQWTLLISTLGLVMVGIAFARGKGSKGLSVSRKGRKGCQQSNFKIRHRQPASILTKPNQIRPPSSNPSSNLSSSSSTSLSTSSSIDWFDSFMIGALSPGVPWQPEMDWRLLRSSHIWMIPTPAIYYIKWWW